MRVKCNFRFPTLVFCAVLASLALFVVAPSNANVSPGDKAPEFTLKNVQDGKQVSLADFKGKVLLIDFWATWCGPCKKVMPHYDKLLKENRERGLVVLAISIDKSERKLKRFVDRKPTTFPMLHDPKKTVATKYGAFRIPTTLLVDRNGIVRSKFFGGGDKVEEALKTKLEELLK